MEVSPGKYAEHLGISRQAVMRQIERGQLGTAVRKEGRLYKIDQSAADKARRENLNPKREAAPSHRVPAKGGGEGGAGEEGLKKSKLSLAEAQTLRAEAQAAMEQLKLQELQGSLVFKEVAKQVTFDMGRQFRDSMLAIPATVSPACASMADSDDIEIYLMQRITDVLLALLPEEIRDAAD